MSTFNPTDVVSKTQFEHKSEKFNPTRVVRKKKFEKKREIRKKKEKLKRGGGGA